VSRPASPPASPLRAASRAHIAEILRRANAGEELSGEDAETARALQQHPEYHAYFALGAEAPDELDGMNPWLHVMMHATVERQRHLLPDVEAAITRLQRRGLTEHEAQHRVAEILTHQIWFILHERQPFNEEEYLQQIRAL